MLRSLLVGVLAVAVAGALPGCENPFDPLQSSDKIQGLTYFSFSAVQAHWDSDPQWDGVQITMSYYNQNSEALNFHDKPHKITIEFYEEAVDELGAGTGVLGTFLTSKTVEFSNSDDTINVPIESYGGSLSIPSTDPINGCLLLRVHPPQDYPQKELVSFTCGVELYKPEDALLAPIP